MEEKERSAEQVAKILSKDLNRLDAIKANPTQELQKLVEEAIEQTPPKPAFFYDKHIYRIVASSLGVVVLVAAVGSIIMTTETVTPPDVLVALGAAAVGALAGMLVPSPTGK